MLQLIYAFAATKTVEGKNEYAFGLKDGLPWGHIKRDMENFAKRTKNSILIMGAKTFMSFKEPLPGRKSIVVQDLGRPLAMAKNGFAADAYISMDQFEEFLQNKTVYGTTTYSDDYVINPSSGVYSVIGGKGVLEAAQPYADRIIQTSIQKKHRVNSDVTLGINFILQPSWKNEFQMVESSWVRCDELTELTETIYERV